MQFLKNLWSSWKIKVTMIGGALVVVTAYGTCTVDPNEEAIKDKVLEEAPKEEAPKEEKPALPEPEKVEEKAPIPEESK
tara:strand:+ start:451 stop:687 length:237 start_codon:yes stop_codon:yes gene_type:complete